MRWFRHRKARGDRKAGLAFAWRAGVSRFGTTVVAVVVVGLSAVLFASMVRVRVLAPPARSSQRASLTLTAGSADSRWFEQFGSELTPFPAPLDVRELESSSELLAQHPAFSAAVGNPYLPLLRELPADDEAVSRPLARTGERKLPRLPALPELPDEGGEPAGVGRNRPVLDPDLATLAVRVPVPLPAFKPGADELPPVGQHRFLIEVDAAGGVSAAVPLNDPLSAPMIAIAQWLQGVRFEPVEAGAGWFGVTVSFISSGND